MRNFSRRTLILVLVAWFSAAGFDARAGYDFVSIQGPGSVDTEPYGISDNNVVTGLYGDANGVYHGFIDQHGILTAIDVPSGLNAMDTLLYYGNSAGLVAVSYIDSNGIYQAAVYNSLTQAWTYLPQPDPSSQFNNAGSISGSGTVFGNWGTNPLGQTGLTAYAYQNGTYTSFLVPGTNLADGGTYTYDANSSGTLVGYSFNSSGGTDGFIRQPDGTISTFDVPNEFNTELFDINDHGELVGSYQDASGNDHGFTYLNGVFTTVDVPGALNTQILGVNNNGVLVGLTFNDPGNPPYDGFIAYSVPAPSSFALVLLGA